MHLVRLAQETADSPEERAGAGVASPCQDLPFQTSVAGSRLRRIRGPVMPTAMHSDVVGQETPDNPVATGGRLNAAKAPPACEECCRAPLPAPADPAAAAA